MIEWTEPLFSAGHWVPDLVEAAGGCSVVGGAGQRSHQIESDELRAAHPDLIVVAPCGFHLPRAEELARQLVDRGDLPDGVPVYAVDADAAFVRPGPRLIDGVEALATICHPSAWQAPGLATFVGTTSAKPKPSRSTISPTVTSSL